MTPKPPHTLRLLHTADWHIGKRLREESRYDDFAEFLGWLIDRLISEQVDVLIVAGDVFDTMTPSNKAQELYYSFLGNIAKTSVKNVVIVAGNHDSPSFLDAPKALLGAMNIYVVGTPTDNPEDEIITLMDNGVPYAIIAGVPYLRDKDIRTAQVGESLKNKEDNAREGIKKHYAKIADVCQARLHDLSNTHQKHIPIIATGHLFTIGGEKAGDNDGMQELYIGGLGAVGVDVFAGFDYVALGHIHKAQKVGGLDHIRYSGSPMMFNFGEIGQKGVLLVDFDTTTPNPPTITPLPTPIFRQMLHIKGELDELISTLNSLILTHKDSPKAVWVKAEYTGRTTLANLNEQLQSLVADSPIKLPIVLSSHHQKTSFHHCTRLNLDQLTPNDVFLQCLDDHHITGELADELTLAYNSLLKTLQENDRFAL